MYKCIRELTEIIFVTRALVDAHIKVNTHLKKPRNALTSSDDARARKRELSLSNNDGASSFILFVVSFELERWFFVIRS